MWPNLCTMFNCGAFDSLFLFSSITTVARMPNFSYITMLHTYETLGWWRRSTEAKRVHFAEEYNEFHHLLIWESLGGDQAWRVRFLAQHAAIIYFFVLILLWTVSPTLAYNFSELMYAPHALSAALRFSPSYCAKFFLVEKPTQSIHTASSQKAIRPSCSRCLRQQWRCATTRRRTCLCSTSS